MEHQPHQEGGAEQPRAETNFQPDTAHLERLLVAFEEEIDQQGWDRPAQLYALNQVNEETIAVHPLHPAGIAEHPVPLLNALADIFRLPDMSQELPAILGPNYIGLLLSFEGWSRYGEAAATTDPSKPLADQVGSVETRGLLLRTRQGQQLMLERIRGQEPALTPEGHMAAGQLIDALDGLSGAINEGLGGTST